MSTQGTSISVSENKTTVSVEDTQVSINIVPNVTTVEAKGLSISDAVGVSSGSVSVTPTGTITATNLQGALEQLADQDFRTDEAPTSSRVEVGDTWYDTNDHQLKIYRQTTPGTFEWVPIMVGDDSQDSDNIDAGAF